MLELAYIVGGVVDLSVLPVRKSIVSAEVTFYRAELVFVISTGLPFEYG